MLCVYCLLLAAEEKGSGAVEQECKKERVSFVSSLSQKSLSFPISLLRYVKNFAHGSKLLFFFFPIKMLK